MFISFQNFTTIMRRQRTRAREFEF